MGLIGRVARIIRVSDWGEGEEANLEELESGRVCHPR
jgi:hypothetical protein